MHTRRDNKLQTSDSQIHANSRQALLKDIHNEMLKRYGGVHHRGTVSVDIIPKRDSETQMDEELLREPSVYSMEEVNWLPSRDQNLLKPIRLANRNSGIS